MEIVERSQRKRKRLAKHCFGFGLIILRDIIILLVQCYNVLYFCFVIVIIKPTCCTVSINWYTIFLCVK